MKTIRQTMLAMAAGWLVLALGSDRLQAQVAMAAADTAAPKPLLTSAQLEQLVGKVALYPDDLLAILLPASTFPLDVVEADRFLVKAAFGEAMGGFEQVMQLFRVEQRGFAMESALFERVGGGPDRLFASFGAGR